MIDVVVHPRLVLSGDVEADQRTPAVHVLPSIVGVAFADHRSFVISAEAYAFRFGPIDVAPLPVDLGWDHLAVEVLALRPWKVLSAESNRIPEHLPIEELGPVDHQSFEIAVEPCAFRPGQLYVEQQRIDLLLDPLGASDLALALAAVNGVRQTGLAPVQSSMAGLASVGRQNYVITVEEYVALVAGVQMARHSADSKLHYSGVTGMVSHQ